MPEILLKEDKAGLPELSAMINATRTEHGAENVLFFHGGDSLSPNTLSAFDKGAHMVEIINLLEPVAMAVAKRELAYGVDQLTVHSGEATFPMISSNMIDDRTNAPIEGLLDHYMLETNDGLIGLIATIDGTVTRKYQAKNITVAPHLSVAKGLAAKLRRQGAELIVLMTDESEDELPQLILSGIADVILVATEEIDDHVDLKGRTLVAYSGGQDARAAHLVLKKTDGIWDTGKMGYWENR